MEAKEAKAVLMVGQGRVAITHKDPDQTRGTVEGEHGVYEVSIDPSGRYCSCAHGQIRVGTSVCSHVLALRIEEIRHPQQVT